MNTSSRRFVLQIERIRGSCHNRRAARPPLGCSWRLRSSGLRFQARIAAIRLLMWCALVTADRVRGTGLRSFRISVARRHRLHLRASLDSPGVIAYPILSLGVIRSKEATRGGRCYLLRNGLPSQIGSGREPGNCCILLSTSE